MSSSDAFTAAKQALEPRMADRNAGFWCPDGWLLLVLRADAQLAEVDPEYRIVQVKEKFGGLRFYIDRHSPELNAIIREVEEASLSVCQNCGADGASSVDAGAVSTLCDDCATAVPLRRGYDPVI